MNDPDAALAGLAVDHVAFGSRDLDAAQDELAALGLSHTPVAEARWPEPDGPHRARTLSVVLADGYLDVIELPAAPRVLDPTGVVLRSDDPGAARARLVAAGVRCGHPYTIHRHFEWMKTSSFSAHCRVPARMQGVVIPALIQPPLITICLTSTTR